MLSLITTVYPWFGDLSLSAQENVSLRSEHQSRKISRTEILEAFGTFVDPLKLVRFTKQFVGLPQGIAPRDEGISIVSSIQ